MIFFFLGYYYNFLLSQCIVNVNVVRLYSALCIASEALLVDHLYEVLVPKGTRGSAGWVSNTKP